MKILHIEDCAADAELVHALLSEEWPDCEINVIVSRPDLVAHIERDEYDLILSDFSLGSFTGLDALKIAREKAPNTPFIFLSGTIGEDRAIEAVQAGAQDYVIKDRMKRLTTAIHRALRDSSERRIREQADLLNKAHDAIIVTGLDGVVSFWNQGAERIFGWTASEAGGQRIEGILGTGVAAELENVRKALERAD